MFLDSIWPKKLPLFIFFRGQPSEEFVEYSLLEHAWVLSAERMYERAYYKNSEGVHCKPYVSDYGYYVFLLDDFFCHEQPPFLDLMKTYGTDVELISGGFTCVLQPCGVGVIKSWKGSIRKYYLDWVSSKHGNLNSNQRLLDAERKEVIWWIINSLDVVSYECICATFQRIEFTNSAISPPATPYPATPFLFWGLGRLHRYR